MQAAELLPFLRRNQETLIQEIREGRYKVSAKYCYVTHELRLHRNDRCKRFTLF